MWPKTPILRRCRAAVSWMNRTILVNSPRGTVASSRMVVGATRASAAKAERRAEASAAAFFRRLRHRDATGAVFLRESGHAVRFLLHGGGVAVRLHQEDCIRIPGQARVGVVLDAVDRRPIKKLKGAGNDLRRD